MTSIHSFHWHLDRATSRFVSFSLYDAKGRRLGAHIRITPVSVVATSSPHATGSCHLADHYDLGTKLLHVVVQPTRDGRNFGTARYGKIVQTAEDADDEAWRRVEGMRKRYFCSGRYDRIYSAAEQRIAAIFGLLAGPRAPKRKRPRRVAKKVARRGGMLRARGLVQSMATAWPAMAGRHR